MLAAFTSLGMVGVSAAFSGVGLGLGVALLLERARSFPWVSRSSSSSSAMRSSAFRARSSVALSKQINERIELLLLGLMVYFISNQNATKRFIPFKVSIKLRKLR